jgi:hypothetical protein
LTIFLSLKIKKQRIPQMVKSGCSSLKLMAHKGLMFVVDKASKQFLKFTNTAD